MQRPEGTVFVETTLKILGGKWKLLILWYLLGNAKRFSELKRLIPDISEKMLTQQLRELQSDGIIERRVQSEMPLRVEYSYTAHGQSLIPVIKALCEWGKVHLRQFDH